MECDCPIVDGSIDRQIHRANCRNRAISSDLVEALKLLKQAQSMIRNTLFTDPRDVVQWNTEARLVLAKYPNLKP